jgi:predicted Zn-dependent protease
MAALGEARELEPADPALARLMAEEFSRVGDLDRAERAYQDLIRLQPELVEPYVQIIDLFRAEGQSPRAIPYARELVQRHPGDRVYRVLLEQLYEDEVRP